MNKSLIKEKQIHIRASQQLVDRLKAAAEKKGLDVSTLIRLWLMECLKKDEKT